MNKKSPIKNISKDYDFRGKSESVREPKKFKKYVGC